MSATEAGFAEINGAQIYYEIAGAGQPLVFVHAGIADRRMWDSQFDMFAERYRVCATIIVAWASPRCRRVHSPCATTSTPSCATST